MCLPLMFISKFLFFLIVQVWMRQRGFPGSADSLNGFLISMLLVHLTVNVGDQKITGNMKAFQIFRICIEALGNLHTVNFYMISSCNLQLHSVSKRIQRRQVVLLKICGL